MYLATVSAGFTYVTLFTIFSHAESSSCMHTLSYAKLQLQWNSGHHLQQLFFFFMHQSCTELVLASNPPSFTIVYCDFSRDSVSLHLSTAKPR